MAMAMAMEMAEGKLKVGRRDAVISRSLRRARSAAKAMACIARIARQPSRMEDCEG